MNETFTVVVDADIIDLAQSFLSIRRRQIRVDFLARLEVLPR